MTDGSERVGGATQCDVKGSPAQCEKKSVGVERSAPPVTLKKSAAKVLEEYYRRRAIMYKEMYEHGSTSR